MESLKSGKIDVGDGKLFRRLKKNNGQKFGNAKPHKRELETAEVNSKQLLEESPFDKTPYNNKVLRKTF